MFATKLNNSELADALEEYRFDHTSTWFLYAKGGLLQVAANRIRQLENEVNAVEWINGRIEKELFECRKRS